jgi:micrococcal nuclease
MRSRRGAIALIGLLWAVFPSIGVTEEWVKGTVASVHDGDTATVVTDDRKSLRVRFYGVDAPERATEYWPDQAYAQAATKFMRKLILNRTVKVRLTGERTYQREVGEVFVEGRSASNELLRAGFGWWNSKHARDDEDLQRLEAAARRSKIGLWQAARPVPPWQFRYQHRRHAR